MTQTQTDCPDCRGIGLIPPFMDPCPCTTGDAPPRPAATGGAFPLADGNVPMIGDPVRSLRDGSVGRIVQTDLKFGAKHHQSPATFVRVLIDGKRTIRSRRTLVVVVDTP